MIEVQSSHLVRTSPETAWRHLTRVADWPRWYPGLHGLDAEASITGTGHTWRSSGQLGRMLYRSTNQVTSYRLMDHIVIEADRRPWIATMRLELRVEREGVHTRLLVSITATPGMRLLGRAFLSGMLRNRLEREAREIGERFANYAEHVLPHH